MRSTFDCGFDDMHGMDVLHELDSASFGSDFPESSDLENDTEGASVWLECNGELLDVGSVKCLGVHKSTCGFETLLFLCPQCNEPHESIRFR